MLTLKGWTPSYVASLSCFSVLEHSLVGTTRESLGGFDEELNLIRIPEVLFLPTERLQIVQQGVPLEAVLYEDHFELGLRRLKRNLKERSQESLRCIDEDVCILANACSRTFGHWMEELLKVFILERNGFSGTYVIESSTANKLNYESLALLGVPRSRIRHVDTPAVFKSAVFATNVCHENAHKFRSILLGLRNTLYERVGKYSRSIPRAWLVRGVGANVKRGGITNASEVAEILRKYDFECIDFGALSFADQLRIDRTVDVLGGVHGSAMVHAGFLCDQREIVEIFSPHFLNPSIIQLCRALGHKYNQVVPAYRGESKSSREDFHVDIDHLELICSQL